MRNMKFIEMHYRRLGYELVMATQMCWGCSRGSRSKRTKNNAPLVNGQAVEENEGHHPHIRWTKIPDFVHVYCGISSINKVFFPTLFGLPRTPHSDCHGLSNRLINTNTSRRSLFFAPKLREPHDELHRRLFAVEKRAVG